MSVRGIDPFLYRSHETTLERRIKNMSSLPKSKEKLSFEQEMRRLAEDNFQLSSGKLSRQWTREQVKAHIGKDPNRAKLYEAAEQFEAFFLEKMFKEMKKNVGKDRLLHGGFAEEIFEEMLLTERVGQMAHQVEFGLAEMIYQQLAEL